MCVIGSDGQYVCSKSPSVQGCVAWSAIAVTCILKYVLFLKFYILYPCFGSETSVTF
jgi:hypothetical protein